jgi:hypothetical protein
MRRSPQYTGGRHSQYTKETLMPIDAQQPTLRMLWEEDELVLDLGALQGLWTAEQAASRHKNQNRATLA